jgi:uncharacterized protein YyaL (SSP411 family)
MADKLAQSTSPYLQLQAESPIHWHAWEPLAPALACNRGKSILLSVGYLACHRCHVMVHKFFAGQEERLDIDQTYQSAHNLLTRRSGG